MIENYQSGLLWRLMRECSYIQQGLQRAGFTGGWLAESDKDSESMLETKWPSHRLYRTIPASLVVATKLVDRIRRKA